MKVTFEKRFLKDLQKIKEKEVKQKVKEIIINLEDCDFFSDITSIKKIKGYVNFYRIRTGNYRLGIFYDNNEIRLVRFLHRKEVYRYFPK